MNIMNPPPAWSFYTDCVERWAYCNEVFSKEECENIIKIGKSNSLYKAKTVDELNTGKTTGVRDSNIVFLNPTPEIEFVYKRLTDIILRLNSTYFDFDLFGFTESLQFTEYEAPTGHYGSHVDKLHGGVIRKLSIVVQLTEETSYTGGDLEILDSCEPEKLSRKQGDILVFPSYTSHRVTPVTTGTRYSLVGWISGKQFK